jgi:FMN-dependent NADH-azoreductase
VKDRLPHLDQPTLKAITTQDPVEAELLEGVYSSDRLIDGLLLPDPLVLACSSGIPESLLL